MAKRTLIQGRDRDFVVVPAAGRCSHDKPRPSCWLFVRDYARFQGGHLKVFEYFQHAAALPQVAPVIFQTPRSMLAPDNPWIAAGIAAARGGIGFDIAFLAGLDWATAEAYGFRLRDRPVINLLQGFAHCRADDPRHAYLDRDAVRICVSAPLAQAVRDTGRCGGPIHVVPAGIDNRHLIRHGQDERDIDVLIAGEKRPALARELDAELKSTRRPIRTCLLEHAIGRDRFLALMGRAKVAVLLPMPTEGFFLPPLEAMAMRTRAVTLDAIGNRQYCAHRENCLLAAPDVRHLATMTLQALQDEELGAEMVEAGLRCAQRHDLAREREQFNEVLIRERLVEPAHAMNGARDSAAGPKQADH